MTGIPIREVETVTTVRREPSWPAWLALAAAGLFSTLLLGLAWAVLKGKIAGLPELKENVASLRVDVDGIRGVQQTMSDQVRRTGTDIESLSRKVDVMVTSVDRMKTEMTAMGKSVEAVQAVGDRVSAIEKQVSEINKALSSIGVQTEANKTATEMLATHLTATRESAAIAAEQSRSVMTRVEEIDREIHEMQEVLKNYRGSESRTVYMTTPAAPLPPTTTGVVVTDVLPVGVNDTRTTNTSSSTYNTSTTSTSAVYVQPVTTTTVVETIKTVPAVAPAMPTYTIRPSVDGGEDCCGTNTPNTGRNNRQTPVPAPAPDKLNRKVKISSIGINSAQKSMGVIGVPFDAVGNFFVWVGEGLDSTFTGTKFIARSQAAK